MTSASHIPLGFCPNCGYAMDPGQCSECGMQVVEDTLLRHPLKFNHRKRNRRALLLFVLLIFLFSAYQFFMHAQWPGYIPTRLLISMQSSASRYPTILDLEICRRIIAGDLSEDQIITVLNNGISVQAKIELHDGHPSGQPCLVRIITQKSALIRYLEGLAPSESVNVDRLIVLQNGKEVSPIASTVVPSESYILECLIPGVAEGLNEIAISGSLAFRTRYPSISYRREFAASKKVRIQNHLCQEHSVPKWSQELGRLVTDHADCAIFVDKRSTVCVQFGLNSDQVDLVGEMQYRMTSESEWMPFFENTAYRCSLTHHVGKNGAPSFLTQTLNREIVEAAITRKPIDLRWIPDACAACTANVPEHFSGAIEWIGVEIPLFEKYVMQPPRIRPTRVIEYTE